MTTAAPEPVVEVLGEAPSIDVVIEENVDLLDDEIIEITDFADSVPPSAPPPAATADATAIDIDEEEPPASSRRTKIASSMDEALAAAAGATESELEAPVKTPPPESGPQEAAPPAEALAPARVPDVAKIEGAGAEFEIKPRRPSAEQVGQTVDLGAPTRAEIEVASSEPPPAPVRDELEAALPKREPVSPTPKPAPVSPAPPPVVAEPTPKPAPVSPAPPATAQGPVVAKPTPKPAEVAAAPPTPAAAPQPIVPEVARRPEGLPVQAVLASGERPAFKPQSFLDLLDASLGLRG
jgi:hypothetical protein